MSQKPTFSVEARDASGKGVARKLRAAGMIPGTCYGLKGEALSVSANPEELFKLLTGARRTNVVFKLAVNNGQSFEDVMVREYQVDPVRRDLLHADFVVVDPEKKVRVTVPVEATGRSKGERAGGRLRTVRNHVEISARPSDIPEKIVYDVSEMDLGSTVLANQLPFPEGVEPAYKMNFAVFQIAVPRGKGKD